MSEFKFADEYDDDQSTMINCPYDAGHRMLRKRLQQHLLKCRLNNPNVELLKCPFNQLHLVCEPEFELHIRYCSNRKMITEFKHQSSALNEDVAHAPIVSGTENWDDEDSEDSKPQNKESVEPDTEAPSVKHESHNEQFSLPPGYEESIVGRTVNVEISDVIQAGNRAYCGGRKRNNEPYVKQNPNRRKK